MKLVEAFGCRILDAALVVATVVGCRFVDPAPPHGEVVALSAVPIASPTADRVSTTAAVACATTTPIRLSSMVEEIKSEFRMEPVADPALPADVETAGSPGGTLVAVTFSDDDGHSALLVRQRDGGYFRLSSPSFLPWRPFSSMEWLSEEVLSFEVWSQPHYGWRYTVNVASEQLVDAVPIHD